MDGSSLPVWQLETQFGGVAPVESDRNVVRQSRSSLLPPLGGRNTPIPSLNGTAGVRFRRGRAKGSYCAPTIRVAGDCRTAPVERGTTRPRVCRRLADRA